MCWLVMLCDRLRCLQAGADVDANHEFVASFTHTLITALSQTAGNDTPLTYLLC